MKIIFFAVVLICFFCDVADFHSDTFGDNPQHEFGQVFSKATMPVLPYWRLEGDAYATSEYVRLVPDRQSKRGSLWNTMPNQFNNWEVVVKLRISGKNYMGADGLAFWYVSDPTIQNQDFFGFKEKFLGFGLIIDTYDNERNGKHPRLIGVLNDGTKSFTHSHGDGNHNEANMELGNCYFGLRNQPPVTLKVTYFNKQITVVFETGTTQTTCFTSQNIYLPTGFYFGFSAATGDLADDHDVYAFAVRNMDQHAAEIDSVQLYGRQVTIHQLTGILSRIEHAVDERNDNMNAMQPTSVSQKEKEIQQPVDVKCDTASLNTEINQLRLENANAQQKITEMLRIVQNIQQDMRSFSDSNQILSELAKVESGISSLKQSSARVEDITGDKTGSYLWTLFCIVVILVLVYIVRVFYLMRKD